MLKLLSLLITLTLAYPLGLYVDDNENYLGLQSTYQTDFSSNSLGGGVSYLIKGRLELGGSFSIANLTTSATPTLAGASATYHIKNLLPINIAIGGGYEIWDFDTPGTANNIVFGGGAYATILDYSNYSFIPSVSFSMINFKYNDDQNPNNNQDESWNAISVNLGIKMKQLSINGG